MAANETGSVFLPGNLINWINDNGGETIASTTTPLRLDYSNWSRIPSWEKQATYDRFVFINIHIDDNEISNSVHIKNFQKIGMIPSPESSDEHPHVQVIDLHNPSRTSYLEKCIISVFDEAAEASELEEKKTLIHVVYKGPAMTQDGKITI